MRQSTKESTDCDLWMSPRFPKLARIPTIGSMREPGREVAGQWGHGGEDGRHAEGMCCH